MNPEIPIACYLTDQELQARRKNYLDKTAELLVDSTEIEHGFIYKFPLKPAILQDLAEIIDLERQCCPFLNFKLSVESGTDFVALELTGAEGTKAIIKSLFGWN
ncbi:MAG TPA: hypothetical protein VNB22_02635 [Pyrinomonadaceae bacterium]|jgi:hypothetical protein|nr:hypothetical protein [Pyrinomonadaceae bacterium]